MVRKTRSADPKAAPRKRRGALPMVVWLAATLLTNSAWAAGDNAHDAGIWTLSVDGANRTCRINLRDDAVGSGWGLSMPPGCRRVLPALKTVQAWAVPGDGQISLTDTDAQPVIVFGNQDAHGFHATDPTGAGVTLLPYRRTGESAEENPIVALAPTGGTPVTTLQAAVPMAAVAADKVSSPVIRSAELPGHYAVLRGERDTGCMITLDAGAPGLKKGLRAHLAPACRDQGVIIFDPLGWQLEAGRLVLTARKGHTLELNHTPEGLWVKDGKDGKVAFGLKPI